jgi:hypothetical protein
MKMLIKYFYIKSDHVLASPTFDHEEIVECKTDQQLQAYIAKQKDQYGNPFKRDKSFGFDYLSNQGAIVVSQYHEPTIKQLKT